MSDGNSQIVRRVWQKHEFEIVTICPRHKTTSIPHVIHLKLHPNTHTAIDTAYLIDCVYNCQYLHFQNWGRVCLNTFSWTGDFLKIFILHSVDVSVLAIRQKPFKAFGPLTDNWNWHFSVIWLRTTTKTFILIKLHINVAQPNPRMHTHTHTHKQTFYASFDKCFQETKRFDMFNSWFNSGSASSATHLSWKLSWGNTLENLVGSTYKQAII